MYIKICTHWITRTCQTGVCVTYRRPCDYHDSTETIVTSRSDEERVNTANVKPNVNIPNQLKAWENSTDKKTDALDTTKAYSYTEVSFVIGRVSFCFFMVLNVLITIVFFIIIQVGDS